MPAGIHQVLPVRVGDAAHVPVVPEDDSNEPDTCKTPLENRRRWNHDCQSGLVCVNGRGNWGWRTLIRQFATVLWRIRWGFVTVTLQDGRMGLTYARDGTPRSRTNGVGAGAVAV